MGDTSENLSRDQSEFDPVGLTPGESTTVEPIGWLKPQRTLSLHTLTR